MLRVGTLLVVIRSSSQASGVLLAAHSTPCWRAPVNRRPIASALTRLSTRFHTACRGCKEWLQQREGAGMTTKADYTSEEWAQLTQAPLMATMAIVAADMSGPIGLVKE